MATIIIPTPLRKFTNNSAKVKLSERNVASVISKLTSTFPELKKHLIDPDGNVASFINIFVDSEDIRNLDQEKTEIGDNTVISIVPAIAGGIDYPESFKKSEDEN